MAIRNEIQIGANPKLNGLVMYRKVDNKPFTPEFTFIDDNTLDVGSNIEVRYQEYYKDSNGDVIPELIKYKTYVVPNVLAKYKQITVIDTPATYYEQGEVISAAIYYEIGDVIVPPVYDENNVEITPAVICQQANTDVKVAAIIAEGGELKTPEISHVETVLDKPAWMAATGWFLQLARTPITAPYGIMDSIESTLAALPMDVKSGYYLQEP